MSFGADIFAIGGIVLFSCLCLKFIMDLSSGWKCLLSVTKVRKQSANI